jgi:hypothetical protein
VVTTAILSAMQRLNVGNMRIQLVCVHFSYYLVKPDSNYSLYIRQKMSSECVLQLLWLLWYYY